MSKAEFHAQSSQVPIFKLPDEILESVFLVGNSEYQNAKRISQVCIRWRIVALSISRLWNVIPLNPHPEVPQWSHELLRRSANSPYIMIPFATYHSLDNLLIAQPDIIPRIRLLSTYGISDSAWEKLLTFGIQLQEIRLCPNRDADNHSQMILPGNSPPVQVFHQSGGNVGRLCSPLPFLAHLVRLSLYNTTCTILQFAFIVGCMPLLKHLHFLGKGSAFLPGGIQPPAISIPHLRYLQTDVPHFLDHVAVSPECVLSITSDPSQQDYATVVIRVADRFIMDHTKNRNSYLTIIARSNYLMVRNERFGYERAQHVFPPGTHDQLELLNYHWILKKQQWFSFMLRIISKISFILPTILSLSLTLTKESQLRELKPYFRHMNSLKSLYFDLDDGSVSNFAPLQTTHDKYGGDILFPSLETLYTKKDFDPVDANSLESYLRWRIEHGKPIKYIKCRYRVDRCADGPRRESISLGTWYAEFICSLESKYGIQGDVLPLIMGGLQPI